MCWTTTLESHCSKIILPPSWFCSSNLFLIKNFQQTLLRSGPISQCPHQTRGRSHPSGGKCWRFSQRSCSWPQRIGSRPFCPKRRLSGNIRGVEKNMRERLGQKSAKSHLFFALQLLHLPMNSGKCIRVQAYRF